MTKLQDKKMSTATITFHAPNNNGSFLQAYALQKVLKKENVDNIIINFYSDKQREQYDIFRKPSNVADVLKNGISMMHYAKLKKRFIRFEEMRNKNLNLTKRLQTEEEVYNESKKYDMLICGSDQIWNTQARDYSQAYMLPGIDKKITYAVSCGPNIDCIDKKKVLEHAKEFSHISVRESSTYNILKENGFENIEYVLDPTLLLCKEDYEKLYDKERLIKGNYVFLYTMSYSEQVLANAQRIGKKYGMKVYAAFNGYSAYKCKKYGIRVIYDMSPDKFLNLIENAQIVCSNSFHGVAFSIIFKKNFYRLCDLDNDMKERVDDRIDGILKKLSLEKVNLNKNQPIEQVNIDYDEVRSSLDIYIKHSMEYLYNALK